MNLHNIDISITGLQKHYRNGDFTPPELIDLLEKETEKHSDHNIWIHRLSQEEITPFLDGLKSKSPDTHPLFGVPFAVKDNLDLAGIPTTAGCKSFTHTPEKHAFVVANLIEAGAIPIGKTNLDQFATGLNGTRSPWGPCKNAFDKNYVSGGSSSGSAVALALGLVSFSLGTDTAGSGRVPAAFNNLIGLKATKGLLSNRGMVPACKSLDVTSIFAFTATDAKTVFDVASQYDKADPYARPNIYENSKRANGKFSSAVKLAVPKASQLEFFGDGNASADFYKTIEHWKNLGASIHEIDFSPFLEAAQLLYEGPWVVERTIATKDILENSPESLDPTVKTIVEAGLDKSAEEAFESIYRLQKLKRQCDTTLLAYDALITPTAGTEYSIEAMLADPITLNSNLGYYTNYMNLLDYAAISIPHASCSTPVPNGFTLVADKFCDQKLLALGTTWQEKHADKLGNTWLTYSEEKETAYKALDIIDVVVCGAHLEGQPLNWQLLEREGEFVKKTFSSDKYKLYALSDGIRPGMKRVSEGGEKIEVEVWQLPAKFFGSFVDGIPAPLGIGKVELEDGTWKAGFICENYGLEGATDITHFGGWRAYKSEKA